MRRLHLPQGDPRSAVLWKPRRHCKRASDLAVLKSVFAIDGRRGRRVGNRRHLAWARCRLKVPGWHLAASIFRMSSICCRDCWVGSSCSSAISAVANASVTTHSSWPVIPFFGMRTPHRVGSASEQPLTRYYRSKRSFVTAGLRGGANFEMPSQAPGATASVPASALRDPHATSSATDDRSRNVDGRTDLGDVGVMVAPAR